MGSRQGKSSPGMDHTSAKVVPRGGQGLDPPLGIGGQGLQGQDIRGVGHGHFQGVAGQPDGNGVITPGHDLRDGFQGIRRGQLAQFTAKLAAFVLLCIGAQIMLTGVLDALKPLLATR